MSRGKKVNFDEYLARLEPYLKVGCSLHEACLHSDLPYSTVQDYYSKDASVRQKIDLFKNWPEYLAMLTVVEGMQSDPNLALKYLERKRKQEFSTRQEHTGDEGKPIDHSITVKYID